MMTNQFVEGFFLFAFWAPPLAVAFGALLLLAPGSLVHRSVAAAQAVPLMQVNR
jgi:hypothetical protein